MFEGSWEVEEERRECRKERDRKERVDEEEEWMGLGGLGDLRVKGDK